MMVHAERQLKKFMPVKDFKKIKKIIQMNFEAMLKAVDHSDTEKFLDFLSEDVCFYFANIPKTSGKKDLRNFLNLFFQSIDHTKHTKLIIDRNEKGDVVFIRGDVCYTRKDGSELNVPFCNVLTLDERKEKIRDYRIYVDNSDLFN